MVKKTPKKRSREKSPHVIASLDTRVYKKEPPLLQFFFPFCFSITIFPNPRFFLVVFLPSSSFQAEKSTLFPPKTNKQMSDLVNKVKDKVLNHESQKAQPGNSVENDADQEVNAGMFCVFW